jgi:hypothetical protein
MINTNFNKRNLSVIKIFKRKLKVVSTILFICLFASSAQAGLMEYDFDNGLPTDWAINENTYLDNGILFIDTRYPIASATTNLFNYSGTYAATISFDFDTPAGLGVQATRWVDIQFYDGSSWSALSEQYRIRQNANAGNYSFEYSGYNTGQFRFSGKGDSGGNFYVMIDNVKIATVPAPHALAIFGFGIIFLVARLRKQNPLIKKI